MVRWRQAVIFSVTGRVGLHVILYISTCDFSPREFFDNTVIIPNLFLIYFWASYTGPACLGRDDKTSSLPFQLTMRQSTSRKIRHFPDEIQTAPCPALPCPSLPFLPFLPFPTPAGKTDYPASGRMSANGGATDFLSRIMFHSSSRGDIFLALASMFLPAYGIPINAVYGPGRGNPVRCVRDFSAE